MTLIKSHALRDHNGEDDRITVDAPSIDSDAGEDFEMLRLHYAGITADQRPISLTGWVAGTAAGAAFWIAFFVFAF